MDFLLKYQHRVQRLISRGGLALGLPALPRSMVIDVRNGRAIESYMYDAMVDILERTPSSDVLFFIDQTTNIQLLTALVRFAHRLDCFITIRSYDIIADIPQELVSKHIFCLTTWSDSEGKARSNSLPKRLVDLACNTVCIGTDRTGADGAHGADGVDIYRPVTSLGRSHGPGGRAQGPPWAQIP